MMLPRAVPFLVAALSLVASAPAASAPVSFTLNPMVTEVSVKPGEEHTGVVQVTHDIPEGVNPKDMQPLRLRVYALDWSLDRLGAPQFGKPNTLPGSCTSWIQVNPTDLVVPPGEKREVRYTAKVPDNAQGTYRSVIFLENVPPPNVTQGRAISINGRIGSILYLQVGPQSRRARITALAVTPQQSKVTIENTGSSHIRLAGVLQFRDESGKIVQQVNLPGGVVLPGEQNVRDLLVDTPKELSAGKYTVTAVVDYGGEVLVGARSQYAVP